MKIRSGFVSNSSSSSFIAGIGIPKDNEWFKNLITINLAANLIPYELEIGTLKELKNEFFETLISVNAWAIDDINKFSADDPLLCVQSMEWLEIPHHFNGNWSPTYEINDGKEFVRFYPEYSNDEHLEIDVTNKPNSTLVLFYKEHGPQPECMDRSIEMDDFDKAHYGKLLTSEAFIGDYDYWELYN